MFGMGFFEILMIGVVAIIFLGPEKLPKALVDMAKFFKAVKKTMDDAKESIEREVNLSQIKEEALAYKNSLTQGVQTLSKDLELKELNLDFNDNLQSPKTTQNQIPNQDFNPSGNSNSSREIKPKESHKTTLSFGANLPQEESTKNAESDSTQETRNKDV
ncbi:Sec-independent protein translocase protein TatB [Helicobacter sp. MIT 05-5294]|uniref:Sec-independent protein translocase protein TatB n=1 Tax=Helicobacter sp. MIT 05-5294 TaxID=1548150 RepID=UPI00051FD6EB|nr:Sec-independent protein translocase protein TatB [Helicobacter sp. MIT 05-5294]TLD87850.1 Sec-independent protein translocase subunit TatB [Helicobacter sp. MIT 05-5294]